MKSGIDNVDTQPMSPELGLRRSASVESFARTASLGSIWARTPDIEKGRAEDPNMKRPEPEPVVTESLTESSAAEVKQSSLLPKPASNPIGEEDEKGKGVRGGGDIRDLQTSNGKECGAASVEKAGEPQAGLEAAGEEGMVAKKGGEGNGKEEGGEGSGTRKVPVVEVAITGDQKGDGLGEGVTPEAEGKSKEESKEESNEERRSNEKEKEKPEASEERTTGDSKKEKEVPSSAKSTHPVVVPPECLEAIGPVSPKEQLPPSTKKGKGKGRGRGRGKGNKGNGRGKGKAKAAPKAKPKGKAKAKASSRKRSSPAVANDPAEDDEIG